ncbi:TnsA endonuclease N-terminal domain-containing protein [Microvirga sp. 17 mud 1-3]|uniref:TnsA endonuclease N-terminal domain-containing protein n=1 Tax=Microvirga sp. 17 mud 1-3 TaxID=2082949 RepID=UPI000D6BD180|nr:hypothetical protein C4E04_01235 [Microvirga sp. 17 mud 1-3]
MVLDAAIQHKWNVDAHLSGEALACELQSTCFDDARSTSLFDRSCEPNLCRQTIGDRTAIVLQFCSRQMSDGVCTAMRMTPAQSILTAYKAGLSCGRVEVPRYSAPSQLDTSDASDARAAYFRRMLGVAPPEPELSASQRPRDRRWHADPARLASNVEARITHRHPALDFAFDGVPFMRIGPSLSGPYLGRQGRFHSLKARRTLRSASRPEFENFLHNELDPEIITFVEQPVRLQYRDREGKVRHYRPDCLVVRENSWEFQEIKLEYDAQREKNEMRWPLIGSALNSLGFAFCVLTEHHLRCEPRWSNIKLIWQDRFAPTPSRETRDAITAALQQSKFLSVNEILARFPGLQRKHIYALVRKGLLKMDLASQVLGLDSHVWLGRGLMSSRNDHEGSSNERL